MDEIRIETRDKKSPFSRWAINRKNAVKFSENPTFRINGKNIGIKEYQNANAVDCNIYDVIEKYRGDLKMTAEQLNILHGEIADEFTHIKSLPDAMLAIKEGEKAWRELPMDIRKEFGNSVNKFIKDGPNYFDNKVKEIKAQEAKVKAERELAEKQAKLYAKQQEEYNALIESRNKWIDAQMKGNN